MIPFVTADAHAAETGCAEGFYTGEICSSETAANGNTWTGFLPPSGTMAVSFSSGRPSISIETPIGLVELGQRKISGRHSFVSCQMDTWDCKFALFGSDLEMLET